MGRFADMMRNPFSFLSSRQSSEDRVSAYIIREHERGRSLNEILQDNYVTNRCTPAQQSRLLERPELIHALGDDTVASVQSRLPDSAS